METTAYTLERVFKKTERTEQAIGKFKLQIFFSGVEFDDKTIIVFKDKSIAKFTDRMDLEKIDFEEIRKEK